jgi:hypothetical protein
MDGWDKMTPEEQQKYGPLVWKKAGNSLFLSNLRKASQNQENGGKYAAFLKKRESLMDQIRQSGAQ